MGYQLSLAPPHPPSLNTQPSVDPFSPPPLQVAFVRVVSGKFEKGMKVKVARSGRVVTLARPSQMFAQSRATVQEGFAGVCLRDWGGGGEGWGGGGRHLQFWGRVVGSSHWHDPPRCLLRAGPQCRRALHLGVCLVRGRGRGGGATVRRQVRRMMMFTGSRCVCRKGLRGGSHSCHLLA
jgi:hypothetical protein